MMQRQNWMMPNYARTRVLHNLLGFFFHHRRITVNQTLFTCGFFLLERALIQTHVGVRYKFGAIWAKFAFASVVLLAVNAHHGCNSRLFPGNSWMFTRHLSIP